MKEVLPQNLLGFGLGGLGKTSSSNEVYELML